MDKVSRLESRACGRDPPEEEKNFSLLPVACGRGLRTVMRACGRDPPYFLFLLEGWRNTSSPLIPAQEFFTLVDVGFRQKPVIVNKIIK